MGAKPKSAGEIIGESALPAAGMTRARSAQG